MSWFSRKPKPMSAADLATCLAAYVPGSLMRGEPTDSVRLLLEEDGVPDRCRDGFDGNAGLLILFVAFLAARRRFQPQIAEAMLTSSVSQLFPTRHEANRAALIKRLEWYRSACPTTSSRGEELSAVISIACRALFESDASDFVIHAGEGLWVGALMKMFDDVFERTVVTA